MIIYEDIFKEFQKQKVKYVLVGGLAANILGSFRATADMDMLVELSNTNLAKIVNILKKKNYYAKHPINPMDLTDAKIREYWIKPKHMKAFNFYKKNGLEEVDIIIDSPISYKEAKKSAIKVKMDNITLCVVSIDKLMKMKKKSNRRVDKLDIEQLKKIKHLKGKR